MDSLRWNRLTKGQCDTIARSHLVNNMYATIDMNDGTLNTENLNRRFIQITHGLDKDSNTVVEAQPYVLHLLRHQGRLRAEWYRAAHQCRA